MKTSLRCLPALVCLFLIVTLSGCSSGSGSSGSSGSTGSSGSGSSGSGSGGTSATLAVTGVSPTKVPAGSGDQTFTITGTGFQSTTQLQVGGAAVASTYVSSTQLTTVIPAKTLANGALLSIVALNGSTSSTASASANAVTLEIDNPSPQVTSFAPTSLTAGSGSLTMSLTGSGFVPSSQVQLNGSARPTAFASSTQVNFTLTDADLASGGTLSLAVFNPAPAGGTSSAASVPVVSLVPGSIGISPTSVAAGSTSTRVITVTGSNFNASSVARVNGNSRPTTVLSANQLTFELSVADQATAGTAAITVMNPAPGGGVSPSATLTFTAPTPTPVLTSVLPSTLLVGAPNSTISISGANLAISCQLFWNTTQLTYSLSSLYINGGYTPSLAMYANVPSTLLTTKGSASITVKCPNAIASTSNALTVTITDPPAPTLTSISPAAGPIGTDQKITLYGTDFTAKSTVSYNGTALATTYTSSGQLAVTLPAKANVLPGNGSFTVSTPAPGGGTSGSVAFTAYVPLPNNDMVFNPVNGLFYASVPSTAGAPYGNSVVSIDPATGALGTPIPVGSEPDRLAVTSDGKYLWVGVDSANAVRKVDLVNGTAGLQFSIPQQGSNSVGNSAAYALAALPGATDSVLVSNANFPNYFAIYDSGAIRGTTVSGYYTQPYAIVVDGSKNEVYAGGSSNYQTYTYSSSGLTLKATGTGGFNVNLGGDMQIVNGKVYPSNGKVYDAESGALQGTLYLSGNTVASGSTFADSALGKIFVLDSPNSYSYYGSYQVQVFSASDYTSNTAIPLNIASSASYYSGGTRLTRWGSNGLAFRTPDGLYSLRSNLVKDLSGTTADLGVSVTASGTSTGAPVTFTAQVTNNGGADSTNVVAAVFLPSNAVLRNATSTAGTCATVTTLTCNLGSLANGASATINISIQPLTAGDITLGAQVSGSENDSVSSNNTASATATVTGSDYNVTPQVSSISPTAIKAGSADTTVTINGSGFNGNSTVKLGSTSLTAKLVSSTQMTATVPADSLSSMGWAPITVSNPSPGGGASAPLPLTVFNVLTAGLNDIAYEPFSRKIYASVGSGSSTLTGNSIAQLTPESGSFNTPVNIGSQPTRLALSSNGNYLYTTLSGANSIARFNLATNAKEFTFSPTLPTNYYSSSNGFSDVAVQPGSETVLAVNYSYYSGAGLVDVDVVNKVGTLRGATTTNNYTSSVSTLRFLDANNLFLYDGSLEKYGVPVGGLSYNTSHVGTYMQYFGSFMLSGKYAYADAGGLADVSGSAPVQVGAFRPLSVNAYTYGLKTTGDAGLGRAYVVGATSTNSYSSPDGIIVYDQKSFLPTSVLPLGLATIEGNSSSYTITNLIRWGQDGLAMLTSTGHVYLLRGAAVVPGLLSSNTAATLTSASSTSIAHGAGNTLLTLTGTNFQPGVAVNWNGSYRTTTIVDATHVTVAIPASDLATAGTASLTAVNPGASASAGLTFTIN